MKYWILVTRNKTCDVISLYSHDLKLDFLNHIEDSGDKAMSVYDKKSTKSDSDKIDCIDSSHDFREFTTQALTIYFEHAENIVTPEDFSKLQKISITPFQHWEGFEINPRIKFSCCSRILPILGHVCNITNHITSAFTTYMALEVTTNTANGTKGTGISITGTAVGSLVLLLVYIGSGASKNLKNIGENIDRFCSGKAKNICVRIKKNAKYFTLSVLMISGSFIYMTTTGIKVYQELTLLTDKYLSLDTNMNKTDRDFYQNLILWADIVPLIASGVVTTFAFQTNYLLKFIRRCLIRNDNNQAFDPIPVLQKNTSSGKGNIIFSIPKDESSENPILKQNATKNEASLELSTMYHDTKDSNTSTENDSKALLFSRGRSSEVKDSSSHIENKPSKFSWCGKCSIL